jgi:NADH-quinone oxidoreductase subunit G
VAALLSGELRGLVVGGVDPDDTADPAAFRSALDAAAFVVAMDLRETEVTLAADVVFPVAPVTDKAGTFVNWEGRTRPFEAVFANPASLPETRILAGIAEELGAPLGFRTVAEARSAMSELGPWDGERASLPETPAVAKVKRPGRNELALATWKLMLDKGSMQDNEKHLAATARTPVCKVSSAAYAALGPMVTLTGDRGSVTLPVEVAPDLADDVVWVPANSVGNGVLADLASAGSGVRVKGSDQ